MKPRISRMRLAAFVLSELAILAVTGLVIWFIARADDGDKPAFSPQFTLFIPVWAGALSDAEIQVVRRMYQDCMDGRPVPGAVGYKGEIPQRMCPVAVWSAVPLNGCEEDQVLTYDRERVTLACLARQVQRR